MRDTVVSRADLFTRRELAARLGVNVRSVIRWQQDGLRGHTLHATVIGARVFYRVADVEAFLQQCQGEPATTPAPVVVPKTPPTSKENLAYLRSQGLPV